MVTSSLFVFSLLHTWVTPVWLLSVGVALGTLVLAAAFGLLWLVSRSTAEAAYATVRESVLLPIFYLALILSGFAVLGAFVVPGLPARTLLASVQRIGAVGAQDLEITVPAQSLDYPLEAFQVRLPELSEFRFESDQPVTIVTNILSNLGQQMIVNVAPGGQATWSKPPVNDKDKGQADITTEFRAKNVAAVPAKLKLHAVTDIPFPEVRMVPATALALVLVVAAFLLLRAAMPKVAAIAATTSKEAMSQPLFYLVLGAGAFLLLAFIVIPYYTFGEDVKMLKDSGLTLIMILAMIVAVWTASVSVSEEVEGRTALTVLSKPVRRRQFILGKFLGVLGPVVVLFVVLGVLFLITISYKVVYDSREVAKSEPPWQLCSAEMLAIVPGLVLAFLETVVLAAISVAISTRLPMLANLIVCAAIYVLGHLVPMLVNSSVGKFEIVRFVGQFIATVLPVLDHFNIQAAVAAGAAVPAHYLWMALAYCVLYSGIALLLGLALFEDRDLA
jgi:ABC-type transport system involved in multi-copper enzyme maturation permease subunit